MALGLLESAGRVGQAELSVLTDSKTSPAHR